MASAADRGGRGAFSLATVIARGFGVMVGNPLPIFGIAFLLGELPQLLLSYFGPSTATIQIDQPNGSGIDTAPLLAVFAIALGSLFVSLFLLALVQGALVRVTLAYAQGRRASLGESLAAGVAKALPLIGLLLLMVFALAFGFALFVVPAILLYVRWAVASPALVAEDLGVFAAFRRSAELTKGARWQIFLLQLLSLIVILVLQSIVAGTLGIGATSPTAGATPTITELVAMGAIGTLTTAAWASLQTSLYIGLRDWKDGPESDTLADVFA